MILTTPHECPDAQRVFAEISHHLTIAASFDGYWHPNLLVDDAHDPRSVFLAVPPRGYLAGNVRNAAFNAALAEMIAREFPVDREALFYFDSPLWGALLSEKLLKERSPILAMREHYTRASSPVDWASAAPAGITIRKVDAEIISASHLTHHDRLIAEIGMSNPGVEAFQSRCFGVCAVDSSTLAGWCLSENNTGKHCEIGIETVEGYQRRGIGAAMGLALVDLAHQRGIAKLGWDCWKRNTASGATALKAGFRLVSDYPVVLALAQ